MFFQEIRENLFRHVAYLQERNPGMLVRERSEALLVDSGLPTETFNKLLWKGGSPEGCAEALREAEEWFAGKGGLLLPNAVSVGARPFAVWAGAENTYEMGKIGLFLATGGYLEAEPERGMFLELKDWGAPRMPDVGVRVVRVRTQGELAAFASVVAANWQPEDAEVKRFYERSGAALLYAESPMRLYVALVGEQPVACGELFFSHGGKVAGLYMICTREAFRRRGMGTLVSLTLLHEAQASGAVLAVLQASREGESVYRKIGFGEQGLFVEYVETEGLAY